MATAWDHYIGLFCPACGKGLQEESRGTERFAQCIRGHRWKAGAEGRDIILRSIEMPKEKTAMATSFCEYGE